MMNVIKDIFMVLTAPFTEYLPKLLGAIGNGFTTLFIKTSETGEIIGLTNLGYVGILFMGIAICGSIVAMILKFMKLKKAKEIERKRRYQESVDYINNRFALDGNGNKVYYKDDPDKYLRLTYGHIR